MDEDLAPQEDGPGLVTCAAPPPPTDGSVTRLRIPSVSDRVRFGPGAEAVDLPLSQFGRDSMAPGGSPALGNARVLTVLVEYQGHPPLRRPTSWYSRLVGRLGGSPPFGPDNPGSLLEYFAENSQHRFRPLRWRLVGPLQLPAPTSSELGDSGARARRIIEAAVAQAGLDLDELDDDADGDVGVDELIVLTVENLPGLGAANRDVQEMRTPRGRTVRLRCAFLGDGHSFTLFAHEVAHTLGAIDLYGWPQGKSARLTLMSQSIGGQDENQTACHLDPWHKLVLGWSEPRVFSHTSRGYVVLPGVNSPTAPIILCRPDHPLEFYLVEFRRQRSDHRVGYESWVPGSGVAIWHVRTSSPGVAVLAPSSDPAYAEYAVMHVGAPRGERGGTGLWGSGAWIGLGWHGTLATFGIEVLEIAEERAVIGITGSHPPMNGSGTVVVPR